MPNRLAAAGTPELKSALAPAIASGEALPGINSMRDVAEHIDEDKCALDQGREKTESPVAEASATPSCVIVIVPPRSASWWSYRTTDW
jgi:hypothetical protein